MKKVLSILMLLAVLFTAGSASALDIVKRGKAKSVVVLPTNATKLQKIAAEDFVTRVEVSTGATLSIIKQDALAGVDKNLSKIFVTEECPDGAPLKAEEYRLVAQGGDLYICGKDIVNKQAKMSSRVTMWAFSHLMEEYMGVKWLWPGELGTVTPEMKNISVPNNLDYSYQTPLERRKFNLFQTVSEEYMAWTARNEAAGERHNHQFQHAFRKGMTNGDWWGRFIDTDPDMLAKSPKGIPECLVTPERCKLCVSNPKVADEVVRLWQEAGAPDYWDITPNDSNAFCTCDDCQALDLKYNGVKYTKEEIWYKRKDNVSLSGRYVWFWNQIITKMRKINPDVEVGVFLYSAYRYPPKYLKLEPGIIGEMCDGFDFQNWQDWLDAGISGIALRPNWLFMGACAPNMALGKAGEYIDKARKCSMRHVFMDGLHEYWATQGAYYYMIMRMIGDYDISPEGAIDEYCDAFGDASKYIHQYLNYWEDYSNKVLFNIPAGGALTQGGDGLYESTSRKEFGSVLHPLQGHWRIMPYLYGADIQAEPRAILDRATAAVSDELTKKRIDYLREGLNMMNKVIDFVSVDRNDKDQQLVKLNEVAKYAKYLDEKFGYWASTEIPMMQKYKVADPKANLDYM